MRSSRYSRAFRPGLLRPTPALAILLTVASGAAALAGIAEPADRDPVVEARALRESGDYAGALVKLRGELAGATDPARPDARRASEIGVEIGSLEVAMGNWPEAHRRFEEAWLADSSNVRALAERGVLLLQEARFPEAVTVFERLKRVGPDDADLDFALGWGLAASGRADEAIPALLDALAAAFPCFPSVGGEPRKQEALLFRRGYFPPDDGDSFTTRSDILGVLGRLMSERADRARAVEYFRQAGAEAPARPDLVAGFGRALLLAGKADSAAIQLGQAASIDPKDSGIANDAGVAFALAGDRKKAIQHLTEAAGLEESRARASGSAADASDGFTAAAPGAATRVAGRISRNRELALELGRRESAPPAPDAGFTLADSLRVADDPRFRPENPARVTRWQPPRVESPPVLKYPFDALSKRLEGTVLLLVDLDPRGRAGVVRVVCADPALTGSMVGEAIRAVREARYRAARAGGEARESRILFPVAFRLDAVR